MNTPEDCLYNEGHLWCLREDDTTVLIGISDNAQSNLGEITFIELPGNGTIVNQGKSLGVIESIKVVNELLSPVSGTVIDCNDSLTDDPTTVNNEPHGDGWMLRIRIDPEEQLGTLMDSAKYLEYIS